ncbi:hypothetical protein HYW36_02435 [Candidatus Saccharibacteria bacterium]|nr:hypothetical protein [Candidatus Saccharibacteria bacterium]
MFYVFLAISLIFIFSLVFKNLSKKPFCSLCVAVASTWLALLVLYKIGRFGNQVLLGLLVGQSTTGIFYLAYRRLPQALRIFSLPFFLSLTAIFYGLITGEIQLSVFILLVVLWTSAWVVFTYRSDPGKKKIATILAECCEDK